MMDTSIKLLPLAALLAGSLLFSWAAIRILLNSPAVNLFKDKPDARKIHTQPVPRLGGAVMVLTFLTFIVASVIFNHAIPILATLPGPNLVALIVAAAAILFIGFFDDTNFITVRVRHKVAIEVIIAFSTVYLLGVNLGRISLFGFGVLPLWLSDLLCFMWIIGCANAYNLIDGLDGLAGSLSLIAIMALTSLAILGANISCVVLCVILAGGLFGFLIHNMPPARTFMGDTGSLFLGTVIAIISLHLGKAITGDRAILVLPLIAGIPILEVFITMVRRYFKRKDSHGSLFERIHSMAIPDNSHMHHRFMYRGYTPLQSTMLLSMMAIILASGAIVCLFIPLVYVPVVLAYLAIPVVVTLDGLGFGGRFKFALHLSKSRYNGFRKTPLIGIIDKDGTFSTLLENKSKNEIQYINLADIPAPDYPEQLHAAVIHNASSGSNLIREAEAISSFLCRPVYVVEDTNTDDVYIREVSKNGSLSIHERTIPIRQLIKDFEYKATLGKIRHPSLNQPVAG